MEFKNIILEKSEGIATLRINRPKDLNILTIETLLEIKAAVEHLRNDSGLRALIITGSGDRVFSAGADIKEMSKMNAIEAREYSVLGHEIFASIANLEVPVIAAINGHAIGGACELALACDIRVASESAKIGMPETGIGITPGWGGMQRLSRLVGLGKAKELVFTGELIEAKEAERIGLVNKVVPPDKVEDAAREIATKIACKAPIAIKLAKDAINRGAEMDLEKALDYDSEVFGISCSTEDQKEGMKAFLEKRKPEFKGK
ncbi:enoyl-CoA hydratase/isomerase family protein [Candidatus Bathyarchaeota archaeon]|nr:enoyl-CoA hydratase/isomerase family protein [Candidatus Bathyarchaeota archaeon]